MTEEEVLQEVLTRLEENNIEYMVTGSQASNVHGLHRATKDADIVIRAFEFSLQNFMRSLQGGYYADESSALDALRTQFMFNVIHLESGFKLDFIVLKKSRYDLEAFERRVKRKLIANERWFISAEDSILSKLHWHKEGASERQLEDAIAVAKGQFNILDFSYLRKWAKELNVLEILEELLDKIQEQT